MYLWKGIEQLASRKLGNRTLKEIFSYEGVSFWWRLKNMTLEKTVRELTSANFHIKCTFRYHTGMLKDKFVGRFYKGSGPKNPKIVVLSLIRNKNKYFKEVEQELIKRKADFSMTLYLPAFPTSSELQNPGGYTLEGFLDKDILKEEGEVRAKFMKLSNVLAKEIESLGIVDLATAKLYARYFTEKEIPETFRLQKMAENMLKTLKPKVVLLTSEDGKHSYPTIVAARKHSIKTVSQAHGTSGIKSGSTYFRLAENKPANEQDFINMVEPHFYLSYGDLDRRQIVEMKCYSLERIIPVGQPRMDPIAELIKSTDKKTLREKHGLPQDKKILLWATQTHMSMATAEENEFNAATAYGAIKELENWELTIKLHPSEDKTAPLYNKYNELFKENKAKIFYSRNPTLTWELIQACDGVMLIVSSVGTEALMIGKPLLLLNPGDKYDITYYTDMGFNMVVHKKEDLVRYLKTIESREYSEKFEKLRQNFVKEACANFGRSAENIADFLEKLAQV